MCMEPVLECHPQEHNEGDYRLFIAYVIEMLKVQPTWSDWSGNTS
jgi:hypothetical protein